jgi:hypothetical protein
MIATPTNIGRGPRDGVARPSCQTSHQSTLRAASYGDADSDMPTQKSSRPLPRRQRLPKAMHNRRSVDVTLDLEANIYSKGSNPASARSIGPYGKRGTNGDSQTTVALSPRSFVCHTAPAGCHTACRSTSSKAGSILRSAKLQRPCGCRFPIGL